MRKTGLRASVSRAPDPERVNASLQGGGAAATGLRVGVMAIVTG